jgi:xanthine dehydrogenase iron-sulfur cluster and FAD-binding subunit A
MWAKYIKPVDLKNTLTILNESMGNTKIIAGGTDLVLEFKKGQHALVTTLIDISLIPELSDICEDNGIIHLGPMVTHSDVTGSALLHNKAIPLVQACSSVGAPQIRNVGTVAGNIISASPANDTITALMAMNAAVTLKSVRGSRDISLEKFYTGLRKTVICDDEILTDIFFPSLKENQKAKFLKFGLRKTQAISLVNVCAFIEFKEDKITKAAVTIGCVSPTVIHSGKAEKYLLGKVLNSQTVAEAGRLAARDAVPIADIRSSSEYRSHLTSQLLEDALNHILNDKVAPLLPKIPDKHQSSQDVNLQNILLISSDCNTIRVTINGKKEKYKIQSGQTLIKFLRDIAGLKGAKESCGEGECGSCTVLLDGKPVLACLIPLESINGRDIFTIEGLASGDNLHLVQKAFIDEGAVQCGYCTPGFVLVTKKLLDENPDPSREDIVTAISGNVCRCTGYYKIIKAVERSAELNRQVN